LNKYNNILKEFVIYKENHNKIIDEKNNTIFTLKKININKSGSKNNDDFEDKIEDLENEVKLKNIQIDNFKK